MTTMTVMAGVKKNMVAIIIISIMIKMKGLLMRMVMNR